MTTAGRSSGSTGRKSPVTTTLPPSTGTTSHESILSVEDSPVNPSRAQGNNKGKTTTVISGLKWSAVSPFSGPLGSLVKMCMASSIWGSSKCVLTWKPLVIKSRCLGFQLVPSMRRTKENESGSWPTPTVEDAWGGNPDNPTPTSRNLASLRNAVKLWPTPRVGKSNGYGRQLHAMVGREEGLKMSGGQLNPTWVEWLMGYPLGWTDLKGSAMPSSRKSRKRSGA